jgi:Ca2+-binding EF-hand superfamily protein
MVRASGLDQASERSASRAHHTRRVCSRSARLRALATSDPVIASWQNKGFNDKELTDLLGVFGKAAKDRKVSKKEKKQGITDVGGKGDGSIVEEEFVKAFSKKPWNVDPKHCKTLFIRADKNKDGHLNFHEFVLLMAVLKKGNPEEKLKLAFDM